MPNAISKPTISAIPHLKQFEAMSVELLNVVPQRKKPMVRRRLQEHRDRLTDSLIGD